MLGARQAVAAHVGRQRDIATCRAGSVCSSDAPFCQYSVEVLVSITLGSLSSPRISAPVANGYSTSGKPWSSCQVRVRAGWPNSVLQNTRPIPATWVNTPSNTRAPVLVAVEALREVIAQIASGLRDAECQRVGRLAAEQVATGRA